MAPKLRTVADTNRRLQGRQPPVPGRRRELYALAPQRMRRAWPVQINERSRRRDSSALWAHDDLCRGYESKYRRLGNSGLKLSELSFGSWVTYGNQLDEDTARECMAAAHDAGVNFFDNAEVYARESPRSSWATCSRNSAGGARPMSSRPSSSGDSPTASNEKNTLNRKYLMQAIDASLARLQLDHVDLVFCHRADPDTPIEETVWAMHDMIRAGKALYWGTSEWSAAEITEAWQIAERHHLAKPVMEQPQYNLFAPGARGKGIRAPVPRYRPRDDHLESARLRTVERQVQRWHPEGIARDAQGL